MIPSLRRTDLYRAMLIAISWPQPPSYVHVASDIISWAGIGFQDWGGAGQAVWFVIDKG
jgi:hypothetical protein